MISRNRKSLALLLDPDKTEGPALADVIKRAVDAGADFIFTGGSLTFNPIDKLVLEVKKRCSIPVVLFPGNLMQITDKADYVILPSLISGRNPELLIGNHVIAAPFLKKIREKVIPAGYILIGRGTRTSVEYMSNTEPIPPGKPDIAIATAIAGELLGMKLIYLEAGSGAENPVPARVITAVRGSLTLPLIVGGGMRTATAVREAYMAGADMIVVGNGVEENCTLLTEACQVRDNINLKRKEATG